MDTFLADPINLRYITLPLINFTLRYSANCITLYDKNASEILKQLLVQQFIPNLILKPN